MHAFATLNTENTRVAVVCGDEAFTYAQLHTLVQQLATGLLDGTADLQEERVALLLPPGLHYVCALLGVWKAGALAVPLNISATPAELEHYLGNAGVSRLITLPEFSAPLTGLCAEADIAVLDVTGLYSQQVQPLPTITDDRRAMMLFTSGTTNKPKGVVTTHHNIHSQITTLLTSWAWQTSDVIPGFLPLHHIHGIINVLCCALWQGATVHLYRSFAMQPILAAVQANTFSVFMAVPTIYVKILQALEAMPEAARARICDGFKAMRLNVSGSAACPVKLFRQWQTATSQVLLERYGMTEIGMALSNPYVGERRAGSVGVPLPGVSVQLFDENHQVITGADTPGEIRIKGETVFLEYWQNPQATRASFQGGWFCTGDVAVVENGYFRIMGRMSVDIIKSGGYKLSALEIEGTLLGHDAIAECAVIGVADETWGEAVSAFIVLKTGHVLEAADLLLWCKQQMSAYKVPKYIHFTDALPRNAMGKVTKPALGTLGAK